jgi:hypothetical protein
MRQQANRRREIDRKERIEHKVINFANFVFFVVITIFVFLVPIAEWLPLRLWILG